MKNKRFFTEALDNHRMLKKGFAALIAAKKVTLSEDVVKELVSRIDTCGDRQADKSPQVREGRSCKNSAIS